MVEPVAISALGTLIGAMTPVLRAYLKKWGKRAEATLETGDAVSGEVVDIDESRHVRELVLQTPEGGETRVPLRNISDLLLHVDDVSTAQSERDEITRGIDRQAVDKFLSETPEAEAIFLYLNERGCLNALEIQTALAMYGYDIALARINTLLRKLKSADLVDRDGLNWCLTDLAKRLI